MDNNFDEFALADLENDEKKLEEFELKEHLSNYPKLDDDLE